MPLCSFLILTYFRHQKGKTKSKAHFGHRLAKKSVFDAIMHYVRKNLFRAQRLGNHNKLTEQYHLFDFAVKHILRPDIQTVEVNATGLVKFI